MNHFSDKTKKARTVLNDMRAILSKFKGDKTDQEYRISTLEELVAYTVLKEVEINMLEQENAKLIMKIGEMQSKLKDMEELYYISEQVNEKSVQQVNKEFFEEISKIK